MAAFCQPCLIMNENTLLSGYFLEFIRGHRLTPSSETPRTPEQLPFSCPFYTALFEPPTSAQKEDASCTVLASNLFVSIDNLYAFVRRSCTPAKAFARHLRKWS